MQHTWPASSLCGIKCYRTVNVKDQTLLKNVPYYNGVDSLTEIG